GRDLRGRLQALARCVNGQECPYNDPHTAGPHLWLLRTLDNTQFECPAAPVAGPPPGHPNTPKQILRAPADMLLCRNRVDMNQSTLANYGRFYPGYARPSNRGDGRMAAPLKAGAPQIDFKVTQLPALNGHAGVLRANFWKCCPLATVTSPAGLMDNDDKAALGALPDTPAVYCVHDKGLMQVYYIGETLKLRSRARAHAAERWPVPDPWLSYSTMPPGTPKHVLRELESDLCGWHFCQNGWAPVMQYLPLLRSP